MTMKKSLHAPLWMVFGSLLSSFCFLNLLHILGFLNLNSPNQPLITAMGLFCVVTALLLKPKTENTLRLTLSLAAMNLGKCLLVVAIMLWFDKNPFQFLDSWSMTFALTGVTLVLYPLYRIPADQFFWSFAALTALLFNIFGVDSFPFINLCLGGLMVLGGLLVRKKYAISYAAVLTLCIGIVSLSFLRGAFIKTMPPLLSFDLLILKGLLVLALVALLRWATGKFNLYMIGALLILAFYLPKALILGFCLLVLGYHKEDKAILTLGILLVPFSLFLYYYNLEVTLLMKSGILAGSGVVLLAARTLMFSKKRGAKS